MKLNVSKTKLMVISKEEGNVGRNIMVDGQVIEQVKEKYFGSVETQERRCVEEIKTRIAIAKTPSTKSSPLSPTDLSV